MKLSERIIDYNNIVKPNAYQKVVAFIFFFFFTAPILSPYIKGITIYLYWFIPFLDLYYIKDLFNKGYNRIAILVIVLFSIILITTKNYITLFKVLAILNTLVYMFYVKKNKLIHYLYTFMFFNIILCMIQFCLVYLDNNLAYYFGPTYISKMVWGKYATETNTNFYTIFLFPRVCGLSREAGFFASLLGITYITFLYDKDEKITLFKQCIFFIGFILSLSKASFLIIAIIIILRFRKIIDKIHLFIGVPIYILVCCLISNIYFLPQYYEVGSESIIHRISGYTIMSKLPLTEMFFGVQNVKDLSVFSSYSFLNQIVKYGQFTGVPNIIIHKGLVIFILFVILLYLNKITFSGFLLITLMTFTTDYFTCTSFSVLAYFFVFMYSTIDGNKRLKNNNNGE